MVPLSDQKGLALKKKTPVNRQEENWSKKSLKIQQKYQGMICCCAAQFQINQGSCVSINQPGIWPMFQSNYIVNMLIYHTYYNVIKY